MDELRAVWLKLTEAVDALETGTGSINDRLFNAGVTYLDQLQAWEFPAPLDERFATLMALLNGSRTPRDADPRDATEGTIRTTTRGMTRDEAAEAARRIRELTTAVRSLLTERRDEGPT